MFDVAISGQQTSNAVNQWSYVLSHWMPRSIFVYGKPPEEMKMVIPFRGMIEIDSLEDLRNRKSVLLAPRNAMNIKGDQNLTTFDHPDDCVYIFGSDHTHFSQDHLGDMDPNHKVYIDTQSSEMYSWVAAAVCLYDRRTKRAQGIGR